MKHISPRLSTSFISVLFLFTILLFLPFYSAFGAEKATNPSQEKHTPQETVQNSRSHPQNKLQFQEQEQIAQYVGIKIISPVNGEVNDGNNINIICHADKKEDLNLSIDRPGSSGSTRIFADQLERSILGQYYLYEEKKTFYTAGDYVLSFSYASEPNKKVSISFRVDIPPELSIISPTNYGTYKQAISFIISQTKRENLFFELIQRDENWQPTGVGVPFFYQIGKSELQQSGDSYIWIANKELPSANYSLSVLSGPLPLDLDQKVTVYFTVQNMPGVGLVATEKLGLPIPFGTFGKTVLGNPFSAKIKHDIGQTDLIFKFEQWDIRTKQWKETKEPKLLKSKTSDGKDQVVTTAKFRILTPGKYRWTLAGFDKFKPVEFEVIGRGSTHGAKESVQLKTKPSIRLEHCKPKTSPKLGKAFDLAIGVKNIGRTKYDLSQKMTFRINYKPIGGGKYKEVVSNKTVPTINPGSKKTMTIKKPFKVTKEGKYKVTITLDSHNIASSSLKKSCDFTFKVAKAKVKKKTPKITPGSSSSGHPGPAGHPVGTPGSGGSSSRRLEPAGRAPHRSL